MFFKVVASTLFLTMSLIHTTFGLDKAEGWVESGRMAKSYEIGIDKDAGRDGKNCGAIKSKDEKIEGNGTIMQKFDASNYSRKKIRLSGYMKSINVEEQASFWIRIDKTDSTAILDNMFGREIKGNTEWTNYEIILEIPENAKYISIGASLNGTGQIWFDDLLFEIVENIDHNKDERFEAPTNLSFEKFSE